MIITIFSIIGYIFCGIVFTYLGRRFDKEGWKDDMAFTIVFLGFLWPLGIIVYSIYKTFSSFFKIIDNLFAKLDVILDTPRVKRIKIDKRIVGYSIDETNIVYPAFLRAIEAAPGKLVYRHFVDGTYEKANENELAQEAYAAFIRPQINNLLEISVKDQAEEFARQSREIKMT